MASSELLRLRAFARGHAANRSPTETSARLRVQNLETIRSCRETVRQAKELVDRLRADRAKTA
jgi:hypothetical protein